MEFCSCFSEIREEDFFKLLGLIMNNYGKHITRKRNTINIELILSNSNLEGERFKFELERERDRQTERLDL